MFTINHQNSFLDALLVATSNSRHTHFLVRADAFRFEIARRLFGSLNMMPIYRMRDGLQNLSNNELIFRKCFKILAQDHALMLFPEANHHQQRQLMPLSKGFARIALGIDKTILIIPVGINYTHHRLFGASVSIYYGKPISTEPYKSRDSQSMRLLRNEVNLQMQKLITFIPNGPSYQLFEDHFNKSPSIYLDPDFCNQLIAQTNTEDLPIVNPNKKRSALRHWIKTFSLLLNYPPLAVCDLILGKINDPVFSSSIKFISGIIFLPIYYLLLALIIYPLWGTAAAMMVITTCVVSIWLRKWSLAY